MPKFKTNPSDISCATCDGVNVGMWLSCYTCRSLGLPQEQIAATMKRNHELRAIFNVIAITRPEYRANALADHETLTREYERLQIEVAV